MAPTLQALGIDRLSVEDRIALATAIWDSIAAEPHSPLLTDTQRLELDRRVAEDDAQPDRYPIVSGDVREAPVSRFPYCIYYRVKPDRAVVIGVVHTARDPAVW